MKRILLSMAAGAAVLLCPLTLRAQDTIRPDQLRGFPVLAAERLDATDYRLDLAKYRVLSVLDRVNHVETCYPVEDGDGDTDEACRAALAYGILRMWKTPEWRTHGAGRFWTVDVICSDRVQAHALLEFDRDSVRYRIIQRRDRETTYETEWTDPLRGDTARDGRPLPPYIR